MITSIFNRTVAVGVFLSLFLVIGCDKGPKIYMVKGTVTYKGEPLEGATITFTPKEGSPEATLANAITNPDGTYSLTAMQRDKFGKGTTKGDYYVTISKRGGPDINVVIAGIPQVTEGFLIPMRYSYPDQSGLSATIVAGVNQCDFDLVD